MAGPDTPAPDDGDLPYLNPLRNLIRLEPRDYRFMEGAAVVRGVHQTGEDAELEVADHDRRGLVADVLVIGQSVLPPPGPGLALLGESK